MQKAIVNEKPDLERYVLEIHVYTDKRSRKNVLSRKEEELKSNGLREEGKRRGGE